MKTINMWQRLLPLMMRPKKGSNGRLVLFRQDNKLLFNSLRKLGCFSFYCDNKGDIIGVSQVIAFLHHGYKAHANGFTAPRGQVEVHHINGDITDNRPENLIYLSKQDHLMISSCTNTVAVGKLKHSDPTPFNRQGRPVENPKHYLANVLADTLEAVSKFRGGIAIKIWVPTVIRSLPKNLYSNLVKHYFPSWMTKRILDLTHTDNPLLRFNYV